MRLSALSPSYSIYYVQQLFVKLLPAAHNITQWLVQYLDIAVSVQTGSLPVYSATINLINNHLAMGNK